MGETSAKMPVHRQLLIPKAYSLTCQGRSSDSSEACHLPIALGATVV